MPRDSQYKSKVLARPTMASRAITASARNMGKLPSAQIRSEMKRDTEWQKLAWNYHDIVTEYHYSVGWVGNILSKAKLTILKGGKPTTDKEAVIALNALFGGVNGQSEMFRQLGTHLTVAGEGYIVGFEDSGDDEWLVAPACDLEGDNDQGWKLPGYGELTNPFVLRLWKPHPRRPLSSDCPTRAALPILGEIHGLTQHVQAQIDSRLSNAGILIVPSEISYGSAPSQTVETDDDGNPVTKQDQTGVDGFIAELIAVAATSLGDRTSPEALVPVVLQVAGEFVDKVKWIKFWTDLDENSIKLRQEAIRRLALGMDMPPEVLEGTADMNHWSSWQVEEAAIKSHSEPLLQIIVSSLTKGYLIPLLSDVYTDEIAEQFSFGYDDSAMRLRPNRSQEAIELYDRGELSGAALLRENGFSTDDLMQPDELIQWILRKIASGSASPDMVNAAAKQLGAILEIVPIVSTRETISEQVGPDGKPVAPGTPDETQDPSLTDHPKNDLPDTQAALSDAMVYRALERAGNKLRNNFNRKMTNVNAPDTYLHVEVKPEEIAELLRDSWDYCDRYAVRLGLDPELWKKQLNAYATHLLSTHSPHTPKLMAEYMLAA